MEFISAIHLTKKTAMQHLFTDVCIGTSSELYAGIFSGLRETPIFQDGSRNHFEVVSSFSEKLFWLCSLFRGCVHAKK